MSDEQDRYRYLQLKQKAASVSSSNWKQTAAGIGRFGLETGGMMAGGALGEAVGLPTGVGAVAGPVVGAGLGSAAGTYASDKLDQLLGVPVPQGSHADDARTPRSATGRCRPSDARRMVFGISKGADGHG